jgi:plasmid stabilization system protein ParE
MSVGKPKPVRWLSAALQEVNQIADVIAQDAPQAAERFVEEIFDTAGLLATSPYLGSECPQSRKARQLGHGSYIIYYTVHRQEVVIRAVIHAARSFRSSWIRREDES